MTDILSTTAAAQTLSTMTEDYKELHDRGEGGIHHTTNQQQQQQQQQQQSDPISSASANITTGPSVPSSCHSVSSRRSSKNKRRLIIFASSSKYQLLVCLLLMIPLLTILVSLILFDINTREEYKNSWIVWVLGWCFILIMVLYMAILPRQVDVRSNGTVAIKTCLLTFHIDDIARAYRGCNIDSNYNSFLRPRVRYATSLDKDGAVVIRRKHDKWDVVVTPQDPEGFINAVEKMLQQKEDNGNEKIFMTAHQQQQQHQRMPSSIGMTKLDTNTSQPV